MMAMQTLELLHQLAQIPPHFHGHLNPGVWAGHGPYVPDLHLLLHHQQIPDRATFDLALPIKQGVQGLLRWNWLDEVHQSYL